MIRHPPKYHLFHTPTLFRSSITINFSEPVQNFDLSDLLLTRNGAPPASNLLTASQTLSTTNNTNFTLNGLSGITWVEGDRKSTRLNSSHSQISYAVFCLKKK